MFLDTKPCKGSSDGTQQKNLCEALKICCIFVSQHIFCREIRKQTFECLCYLELHVYESWLFYQMILEMRKGVPL